MNKLPYPIAKRSALHTFGKDVNVRIPRKHYGTKIKTTTNRKKSVGKTKLPSGVNPKCKQQKLQIDDVNYKVLPSKRITRKQHKLGKLVEENKSVAKDHSRKPVFTPIANI